MPELDPGISSETLAEIARSAIPGDTRAFRILVERNKERVLANCRFLSGSSTDAEDLAQEVFVKAYLALEGFDGRSQFSTWLQRIKINHCLSHLRRQRGRRFFDVHDPQLELREELRIPTDAQMEAARISDRDRVQVTLDTMPDILRIPLVMCDLDGLAYQEIADVLGIGLSATKMRIKRAREVFRKTFERLAAGSAGTGGRPTAPTPDSASATERTQRDVGA